jgi:hypothetical protein
MYDIRGAKYCMTLSKDCEGCGLRRDCTRRFRTVHLDGKVYCPDGTAHLVDYEVEEEEVPLP